MPCLLTRYYLATSLAIPPQGTYLIRLLVLSHINTPQLSTVTHSLFFHHNVC